MFSKQISNSTSPMDTKFHRVVANDIEPIIFHWWIFFHLRIVPLILYRAIIRLFLLVRQKEISILTFLNLCVILKEMRSWILYHYLPLVNFPFSYWILCKVSRSETLFPIGEVSRLTLKGKTWYIHDFIKAVGNNIRASSTFNADVIACFWYFNNNIFSIITPFGFDNDNVSLIQIFRLFRLHTWVLFVKFSFLCRGQK